MSEPDLEAVLAALGLCVFEGTPDGRFRLRGAPTDWLRRLHGDGLESGSELDLAVLHPVLASFLPAAERTWSAEGAARLCSGLWTESDGAGGELQVEAIALRAPSAPRTLCILQLDETYALVHRAYQGARESLLNLQRLRTEVEKKELLLHCIAHDLKGPLAGIVGHLSLIESRALAPERAREIAGKALAQTQRQLEMIRQVSELFAADLMELEAFETRGAKAPDLSLAVGTALETCRPAFVQRGVELRSSVGQHGAEPLRVVGSQQRLERVLVNLLENALRHAPTGSAVDVSFTSEGPRALVRVEDRGPGVPEELRARLFEKYARAESSGGLAGLGLYSARRTLEHWGGTIGYEPRAGGGASFWFSLPSALD